MFCWGFYPLGDFGVYIGSSQLISMPLMPIRRSFLFLCLKPSYFDPFLDHLNSVF